MKQSTLTTITMIFFEVFFFKSLEQALKLKTTAVAKTTTAVAATAQIKILTSAKDVA